MLHILTSSFFFFFNDTATTEIYTLSLHDALPILGIASGDLKQLPSRMLGHAVAKIDVLPNKDVGASIASDRKSTRLNSSHITISYAVFCLKKKKKKKQKTI